MPRRKTPVAEQAIPESGPLTVSAPAPTRGRIPQAFANIDEPSDEPSDMGNDTSTSMYGAGEDAYVDFDPPPPPEDVVHKSAPQDAHVSAEPLGHEDQIQQRHPVEFPDEVLARAQAAGLPENVARSFSSPNELMRFLDQRGLQPAHPPPNQQEEPRSIAKPLQPKDYYIDPDKYDADLAKAYNALVDHNFALHAKVEALQNNQTFLAQQQASTADQRATQVFEQAIGAFPDGIKEHFGGGKPRGTLVPYSEQAANYDRLKARTAFLAHAYLGVRQPIPDNVVEQALSLEFGNTLSVNQPAINPRAEVAEAIKHRNRQVLPSPGSRAGKTASSNPYTDAEAFLEAHAEAFVANDGPLGF